MTTEPRALPLADLPDHVAELLQARGAAQVNLYRALANSPTIVDAWLHFLWGLRDGCHTRRSLRELMILRTAARSRSDYEWAHHVRMARDAGVSDDRIAAIKEHRSSDTFDEEERLALALADAIVDGSVPDGLLEESVRAWGPDGYVELVVTTSTYVMVPRVLDALRVPLEGTVARTGFGDQGSPS